MFSIGLIADTQAGNFSEESKLKMIKKDKKDPEGVSEKVREALSTFEKDSKEVRFLFVVQMGDLIEGHDDMKQTLIDFNQFIAPFEYFHEHVLPVHHVVGNHCLSVPRQDLLPRLNINNQPGLHAYYRIPNTPTGWCFLVLDSMDVSLRGSTEENTTKGMSWRENHLDLPNATTWNGSIGEKQQLWIQEQCKNAKNNSEKVIFLNHIPTSSIAASTRHILWNCDELLEILRIEKEEKHVNIVAYISGHCHVGGYAHINGIHHITVHGLIEAPKLNNAFARLDCSNQYLKYNGYGIIPTRILPLSPLKLFHFPLSHCSRKVRWLLHELNIPYESKVVDLRKYEQFEHNYAVISPNMVVPVVEYENNYIRDSRHILLHLNEIFGFPLSPKKDTDEYKNMLYWLDKQDSLPVRTLSFNRTGGHDNIEIETEVKNKFQEKVSRFDKQMEALTSDQSDLLNIYRTKRPDIAEVQVRMESDPIEAKEAWKICHEIMDEMEIWLSTHNFLAYDSFSIADVAVGSLLWRLSERKLNNEFWGESKNRPHVLNYFERIIQRQPFQEAVVNWLPNGSLWPF